MENSAWQRCIETLESELAPEPFNTYIRPLQATVTRQGIRLFAPNSYVRDTVQDTYVERIRSLMTPGDAVDPTHIEVLVGDIDPQPAADRSRGFSPATGYYPPSAEKPSARACMMGEFTFDTFVTGKSNQMALAASQRVADRPGTAYNPLFIYGGVGLGKTHLMQAIGNDIRRSRPDARVVYQNSEGFVTNMVTALKRGTMDTFKQHYRSADVLLIDDVQFFAGKDRSQEEFFHTFNALLEDRQQVVVTCDRFAKEVEGLEERLKSRFSWGMPVSIEPPDMETRAAILMRKAEAEKVVLLPEIALFIAKHIRSNVRELEGVLRRVVAHAQLVNEPISLEITRDAIKDVLAVHTRQTTVENIQRTVANYYKLRVSDLVSKRRTRTVVRPRQVAMALSKELTQHSYPELGEFFGGRDHTTVIHGCRKVEELRAQDVVVREEYEQLLRLLSA